MRQLQAAIALALLLAPAAGCRLTIARSVDGDRPPPPRPAQPAAAPIAPDDASPVQSTFPPLGSTGVSPAASEPVPQGSQSATVAAPTSDAAALAEVLAELQSLGVLTAAEQTQLMADLKRTPVHLWPQIVQAFRTSLAYRKQYGDREPLSAETSLPSNDAGMPAAASASNLDMDAATLASHQTAAPAVSQSPAEHQQTTDAPSRVAASSTPASNGAAIAADAVAHGDDGTSLAFPSPASALSTTAAPISAPEPNTLSPTVVTIDAAPAPQEPSTADAADDWQTHLSQSLAHLEARTRTVPTTTAEINEHVQLRLLYLVAGRREQALTPIEGISAAQQDFWKRQLFGLSAYLDSSRQEDSTRRAAEALVHLREATAKLSEAATLVVRNIAFCTEVSSYGVYKKFEPYEFAPGQEVMLYAELENFKSEHTERGYHTSLKSSYQILDSRGARVAEQDFSVTEEYCQNVRRDFFIRFRVFLPKRIFDGDYTLQLTVEDTKAQKIGQSTIGFKLKEK